MAGEFNLKDVLPWGRNRAEYCDFFALQEMPPGARILDCGSGPSSFNAEMTAAGYDVISADPIYQFSAADIAGRVDETRIVMRQGLEAARDRFVLDRFGGSPDAHEQARLDANARFLADFCAGKKAGRYRNAALPDLPFGDGEFDLVLSSHFLLLYSDHLDFDFHLAAIREMTRVAREVRIFPLLDLDGKTSAHLCPLRAQLEADGWATAVERVDYELQKGGNKMLRISAY